MKHLSVTTAAFLRKRFSFLLFFLVCLGTVSCSPEELWDDFEDILDDVDGSKGVPEVITFHEAGLYPEGVGHDAVNRRFVVSSVSTGTVGTVRYDGTYSPFITDNRLISSIGLRVDESRKRVLVAGADPGGTPNSSPGTAGQTAVLGIYDLETGTPLHFVDLAALRPGMPHFANDITLDHQGNAYVTDSFSPIIYKVDVGGNASVFYENNDFATQPGAFGFNGIAFHPAGYLLVAYSVENAIYRIPLHNTAAISEVQLNAPLESPDGLLLSQNGKQLVVVNNAGGEATGRVLSFESNDRWASGTLTDSFVAGPVFPTTATGYGDDVYVLYAHLHKLLGGVQPPQEEYTIRRMPFSENETFGL
ncbi:SMP-30/gluconolactonase/LRE family protein [Pontibacter brevis]